MSDETTPKPKPKGTFQQQMRQRAIDAQRKASAALQKKRREEKRAVEAKQVRARNAVDGNGLTASMRAALVKKSREAAENPKTKALIAKAHANMAVAEVRRVNDLGNAKPAPGFEFGRPIKTDAPAMSVAQKLAAQAAAPKDQPAQAEVPAPAAMQQNQQQSVSGYRPPAARKGTKGR